MSLFTSKPGMKGKAPESEASREAKRQEAKALRLAEWQARQAEWRRETEEGR